MSNTYLHLDTPETLEHYRAKLDHWKRDILYQLFNEMRAFHESLAQDNKWYGRSHEEFKELFIEAIYNQFLQPAAQTMDDARDYLARLQLKAEELG